MTYPLLELPAPDTIQDGRKFMIRVTDVTRGRGRQSLPGLGLRLDDIQRVNRTGYFIVDRANAQTILERAGVVTIDIQYFNGTRGARLLSVTPVELDNDFPRVFNLKPTNFGVTQKFAVVALLRLRSERRKFTVKYGELNDVERGSNPNVSPPIISFPYESYGSKMTIELEGGCVDVRLARNPSYEGIVLQDKRDNIPYVELFPGGIELLVRPLGRRPELWYRFLHEVLRQHRKNVALNFDDWIAKRREASLAQAQQQLRAFLDRYGTDTIRKLETDIERKRVQAKNALRTWSRLNREVVHDEAALSGLQEIDNTDRVADQIQQIQAIEDIVGLSFRNNTLIGTTTHIVSECVDDSRQPNRIIGPYDIEMNVEQHSVIYRSHAPIRKDGYQIHGPHLNSRGEPCHDQSMLNQQSQMIAKGEYAMAFILGLQLLKQWRVNDDSGEQALDFPRALTLN